MDAIKKKTGMAVTSLVLGILSCACFGILVGIPAIILGHIAYNRARKLPDQYGGGRLALVGFVTGYASLIMTVVLAALLLPALAQAQKKAQRTWCMNNLKQVGRAFQSWADAHAGQYPFNVPAREGGTLEFCKRSADGSDANAWRHLLVLSNELHTPKVLVCPGDVSRHYATNFTDFAPENLSYQIFSGTNVTSANSDQVLARCPVHDVELLCDGTVRIHPKTQ